MASGDDRPFDPQPVVLEGVHVRLEPVALHHASDLYTAGRDGDFWRFLPRRALQSVEDARSWIETTLETVAAGHEVVFATVYLPEGRAVGSTRFLDIRREDRGLEIGWTWIGTPWQRTAVNTESKLLLLRHAFESLGAIRVQLKTDGRNDRSQRAIERIGGVREGTLRLQRRNWDGFVRDTVYYSILADEWPAVKGRLESHLRSR